MFSTVFITTPDRETATGLAERLVSARLAACANIFPVGSIYRWERDVVREEEHALLLKIMSQDFQLVQEAVLRTHPHKVPCIVRHEIAEGFPPYLEWVRESTARPKGD
jgi:periplasmic divalent cation tolerance protein